MFSPQQPMRNYPQPGPPRPMPNQRMMAEDRLICEDLHLEHSSKVFSKPDNFFPRQMPEREMAQAEA